MPVPISVSSFIAEVSPRLVKTSPTPAFLITISLGLLMAGCGQKSSAPSATGPMPPMPVTFVQVELKKLPILIESVGTTEGAREIEVRARVSGILQKQLYTEGEAIRRGAPLFQIDRASYEIALAQARASLAQEVANNEKTRRESARLKQLAEEKAISQREYDDATSATKQSDALLQAAQARVREAELNLSYTSVIAPIGGTAQRALRSEGSLVQAGTESSLLTTLSQSDPIRVRFAFSESEYAQLRSGKGSEVRLMLPDGQIYKTKGQLNFTGTTVDSKLGTVQLRAEFANPDLSLLPGQFVRAQVVAGEQEAFLVPQAAVLTGDQGPFVWTIGPENKAIAKPVEAAQWQGSEWVIRKGLTTGDKVITNNLIKLRPGVAIEPITAGASSKNMPSPATKSAS
jgi:membrane fusion protein (multidrug efflux system)